MSVCFCLQLNQYVAGLIRVRQAIRVITLMN